MHVCHLCTKLQHIKILFQLLSGLRKRVPCEYQALDLVISNPKRFLYTFLEHSQERDSWPVKDTFRFLFSTASAMPTTCKSSKHLHIDKWSEMLYSFALYRLLSSFIKGKVGNIEFWVLAILCIRYFQQMWKTHIITNCGGLPRNKGAGVL